MWPMRSHTLVNLTKIMYIKRNFKWMEVEQDGFDKTYPDFNKTFKIRADASSFQLGVVTSKKVKPIALYSRKLTCNQQRYKLTKIELLSIVETLKEFITIILGQKL